MSTRKLDPAVLAQFTGTEHWYRHDLVRDILFTDGANLTASGNCQLWRDCPSYAERAFSWGNGA